MHKKRTQDSETRRRQILDAARSALRKKPYHALSMDDIAKTGKMSKGLLYLYFEDKEQLFAAATHDMLASLGHLVSQAPKTSSPLEDLRVILVDMLAFGEENREYATQFVGEQLAGGNHAASTQMSFQAFLKELGLRMQACVDAGLMRDHDTQISSECLIELAKLYMRRKYLTKQIDRPLSTYASEILDYFLNGFGRAGSQRP